MKKEKIFAVLCGIALALVFVGCASATKGGRPPFEGTWEFSINSFSKGSRFLGINTGYRNSRWDHVSVTFKRNTVSIVYRNKQDKKKERRKGNFTFTDSEIMLYLKKPQKSHGGQTMGYELRYSLEEPGLMKVQDTDWGTVIYWKKK